MVAAAKRANPPMPEIRKETAVQPMTHDHTEGFIGRRRAQTLS